MSGKRDKTAVGTPEVPPLDRSPCPSTTDHAQSGSGADGICGLNFSEKPAAVLVFISQGCFFTSITQRQNAAFGPRLSILSATAPVTPFMLKKATFPLESTTCTSSSPGTKLFHICATCSKRTGEGKSLHVVARSADSSSPAFHCPKSQPDLLGNPFFFIFQAQLYV